MTASLRNRTVQGVVVALLTCAASVTIATESAQATCVGPRISTAATTVARGQTIRVTGDAWGTDCKDTGPNPGKDVLGAPATGIVIEIVQDGQHTVLAKGNASGDYTFAVRLKVPSTLRPGPATLTAGDPATSAKLTISSSPPAGETQASAVHFGPSGGGTSSVWWGVGAVVVVIAGALMFSRKIIAAKVKRWW